jgi:CAP12/Pycsar effector protein, TIR domain
MTQMPTKSSVFVGSSSEGLRIAQTVQVLLDPVAEVELWCQGVFGLSQGTLESLVLALDRFDFAVLVLTADDLLLTRGVEAHAARDNVLFELGLFAGGIGRDRTFMLYDRTNPPRLPSDLAGIAAATYAPHATGNFEAALGAACTKIQNAVERSGVRRSRGILRLSEAAAKVEGAESTLYELVKILARSRKVELDIISAQFGPLIEPQKLGAIRSDLRALEAILEERRRYD